MRKVQTTYLTCPSHTHPSAVFLFEGASRDRAYRQVPGEVPRLKAVALETQKDVVVCMNRGNN